MDSLTAAYRNLSREHEQLGLTVPPSITKEVQQLHGSWAQLSAGGAAKVNGDGPQQLVVPRLVLTADDDSEEMDLSIPVQTVDEGEMLQKRGILCSVLRTYCWRACVRCFLLKKISLQRLGLPNR